MSEVFTAVCVRRHTIISWPKQVKLTETSDRLPCARRGSIVYNLSSCYIALQMATPRSFDTLAWDLEQETMAKKRDPRRLQAYHLKSV